MVETSSIAALSDNYIWTLRAQAAQPGDAAAIIDPGEAGPVLHWLQQTQTRIGAIIITHRHADHTGGVAALLDHARNGGQPQVPVYGPDAERDRVPHITQPLTDGDTITLD